MIAQIQLVNETHLKFILRGLLLCVVFVMSNTNTNTLLQAQDAASWYFSHIDVHSPHPENVQRYGGNLVCACEWILGPRLHWRKFRLCL